MTFPFGKATFLNRSVLSSSVQRNEIVLLASYPRSGNTLIRNRLEQLTGTLTGSDTRVDRKLGADLARFGLRGEGVVDPSKVWLIKTHWPERAGHSIVTGNAAIVLVRNVFNVLNSYFNMLLTATHTESICPTQYHKLQDIWSNFVHEESIEWSRFHRWWLEWQPNHSSSSLPLLCVRYEDILDKPNDTLTKLKNFLLEREKCKTDSMLKEEMECRYQALIKSGSGTQSAVYKPRAASKKSNLKHFSDEQIMIVLKNAGEVMLALGYQEEIQSVWEQVSGKQAQENIENELKLRKLNWYNGDLEEQAVVYVNVGAPLRQVRDWDLFARGFMWKWEARQHVKTISKGDISQAGNTANEDLDNILDLKTILNARVRARPPHACWFQNLPTSTPLEFENDGYMIVKGALRHEALDFLKQQAVFIYNHRHEKIKENGSSWLMNVHQTLDENSNWVASIATDPSLIRLVQAQLGENLGFISSQLFVKPPQLMQEEGDGGMVPWHQDGTLIRSVWIALDDINEANGGLQVLPGWHKRGMFPTKSCEPSAKYVKGKPRVVHSGLINNSIRTLDFGDLSGLIQGVKKSYEMQAGDIAIHHPTLPHCSGENVTERWRRVLILRYVPLFPICCRISLNAMHLNWKTGETFCKELWIVKGAMQYEDGKSMACEPRSIQICPPHDAFGFKF